MKAFRWEAHTDTGAARLGFGLSGGEVVTDHRVAASPERLLWTNSAILRLATADSLTGWLFICHAWKQNVIWWKSEDESKGVLARLEGWAHPASTLIRCTIVGLCADGFRGGDGGDGGGGRPDVARKLPDVGDGN